MNRAPLHVVHVVYGFHAGGLENGIVSLVNHLPADEFRHTIVALTTCSPSFCERITQNNVDYVEMNKGPGHALKLYPALYRLFKDLKPNIVHSRNLAALETAVPAWAAGVPVRIHGEHGWDAGDPEGKGAKYAIVRRLYRPFVTHYVVLSRHIESYVNARVGVPTAKVSRICNGVDTRKFCVSSDARELLAGSPLNASRLCVVGTVGRLQAVKDQSNLIQAFALIVDSHPDLRLMIVGDGATRPQLEAEAAQLGVSEKVWMAGERDDIPEVMRAMDVFVLPSQAEGISNTILEAMASGLPVVATRVGGNDELVVPDMTGKLVPPFNAMALGEAIAFYASSPERRRKHGLAGRERVEAGFSLQGMIDKYSYVYTKLAGHAAGKAMKRFDQADPTGK